jgi:2-methylcitrate dehydratase
MDPKIREQLNKVEVEADPEIERVFPALQRVIVQIQTRDGRTLQKQLDFPKGDPRNPLTDQEIEEKFASLADAVLSKQTQNKVKETIWSLERVGSVSDLMALMESDIRKAKPGKVDRKARTRGKNSKNRRSVLVYHHKPS